jgi:hypothetical protein
MGGMHGLIKRLQPRANARFVWTFTICSNYITVDLALGTTRFLRNMHFVHTFCFVCKTFWVSVCQRLVFLFDRGGFSGAVLPEIAGSLLGPFEAAGLVDTACGEVLKGTALRPGWDLRGPVFVLGLISEGSSAPQVVSSAST